jgi:hypothetical protein
MKKDALIKDPSIHRVLEKLYEYFGAEAFDIVDHWTIDPFAVGIGKKANHEVLAYISTSEIPGSSYCLHLELPPEPESDCPYTPAGQFDSLNFQQLVEKIGYHLDLKKA